jgi:hypothetical protein
LGGADRGKQAFVYGIVSTEYIRSRVTSKGVCNAIIVLEQVLVKASKPILEKFMYLHKYRPTNLDKFYKPYEWEFFGKFLFDCNYSPCMV